MLQISDLGYTGAYINGETVYMPKNETELKAIQALANALDMQKDVVDGSVVAAVNQRLGKSYTSLDIVNNIDDITAALRAANGGGKKKWLWPVVIGGGVLTLVGAVIIARK